MSYQWHYVDVSAGDWTFVVIFMRAPVFSPRARACAVNVATYHRGRRVHWVFSEYDRLGAPRVDEWRIGASSWHANAIRVSEASPFGRVPVELAIELEPLCAPGPEVTLHASHRWQAIAPRARAFVAFNGERHEGIAYRDSNWGDVPLGTDLTHWTWCREHGEQDTTVRFTLPGEDTLVVSGGRVEREPAPTSWRRSGWGLALPAHAGTLIESSPFYARLLDGPRLTEVAHFAKARSAAYRWMPYFRSRVAA